MGREGVAICAPLPHEPSRRHRAGQLRAVCCVALGGSGRADGRAPGPSSGQSGGRPAGPPADRTECSGAGCMAGAGWLQGGALRLPGWLWPRGWADTWSSSGRSREQPADPRAGRMPGRGRAAPARCAAALWAALAARMGGHLVPAPGSQQDGQTAHQRAGLRATGLVLGHGRIAPGRCAAAPWAALAGWMGWHLVITAPGGQEDGQEGHQQAGRLPDAGQLRRGAVRLLGRLWPSGWTGTWSQLRTVRRPVRRPTSGPG